MKFYRLTVFPRVFTRPMELKLRDYLQKFKLLEIEILSAFSFRHLDVIDLSSAPLPYILFKRGTVRKSLWLKWMENRLKLKWVFTSC